MKDLISLKAVALCVSMLACSITFSGCSDDESDANQAEVVFPDNVNPTKMNCAPKVGHNIRSYEKKYVPT